MTDTLTVSRELLRQAIEALNEADNVLTSSMFAEAATALRAALEQPAPVQEQHPVAWACLFTDDGSLCQTFDTQKEADKWVESDDNLWDVYVAPLYTVQPRKAVKLSDDEISTIAIDNPPNVHIYARAIEQAVLKANGIEP